MKRFYSFVFALLIIFYTGNCFSENMSDNTTLLNEHLTSKTANVIQTNDETIIEDYKSGFWYYHSISQGLRVEITRHRIGKRDVLWYEADVRTCAKTPLDCFNANPENPGHQPFHYSDQIARDNKLVFAISGDMFGHRKYNAERVGIVIRDGKILSDQTRKHGVKVFPNLDLMTLFADGSLKAFESDEHSAEEYLSMGATDVFCFGPWLIRNGQINPETEERWKGKERRMVLGYYSPYHYIAIYTEGWNKVSQGASLEWVAKRMKELGVQEAVNLDGGHSAALIFMGKKLRFSNPKGIVVKDRALDSVIGTGFSDHVPEFLGVGK